MKVTENEVQVVKHQSVIAPLLLLLLLFFLLRRALLFHQTCLAREDMG